MNKAQKILNDKKRIIGIWGYPDPVVLNDVKNKYPNHEIIDFDIDYNFPSSNILPDAYCKIMHNILDNAAALKDNTDIIIASVGEEKCDSARIAALILEDSGFNVIQTKYTEYKNKEINTPICQSDLSLQLKIENIMDSLIVPTNPIYKPSTATLGFWGVPPNDFSIFKLFPNTTHVYGWIRCVEAQRPADMDIEMYVDESVPTVFFAQAFCAKMQLAKYLAKKYNGLYVDVDDVASNSVKAKIEAFIRLG